MNQTDLYDIAQQLYRATPQSGGEYYLACCPFHDDNNPSFLVNSETYNCLSSSCGKKGKTEHLLQIIETGVIRPKTQEFSKNPFIFASNEQELSDYLLTSHISCIRYRQMNYWKSRAITKQTILDLKLGYRDNYATIPVTNKVGHIIGGVGRNTTERGARYTTPRGQGNLLYIPNWQRFEKSKEIYFPFGMIDAISLSQENYPVATFTNGKRPDPDLLEKHRKIFIIIPDKGEEKDAFKLAGMLGWRGRVLMIEWEKGCKDISDILMKHNEITL